MKRIEKLVFFFGVVLIVGVVGYFFGTNAGLAAATGILALHLAEHETSVRQAYLAGRTDAFDRAAEIVHDEIVKVRGA